MNAKGLVILALCLLGTARGQVQTVTPPVVPNAAAGGLLGGLHDKLENKLGGGIDLFNKQVPHQLGEQLNTLLSGAVGQVRQGLAGVAGTTGQLTQGLSAQYANAATQLDVLEAQYEALYCSPARFEQSVKKPAKFVGQSFAITFDTGACSFDDTKFLKDHKKQLDCVKPAITHVKIPGNFSSKFHSAPKFVNKVCSVTKVFGDETSQVLFVFDGKTQLDVNTLSTRITEEVKNLLSGVAPKTGNPDVGVWSPASWGHDGQGLLGSNGLLGGSGLLSGGLLGQKAAAPTPAP